MSALDPDVRPPKWPAALLSRMVPPGDFGESILGDLHEEFLRLAHAKSLPAARGWYWRQALAIAVRRGRLHPARGRPAAGLAAPFRGWWAHDARWSVRVLRRRPSFLIAAATTVALGTGATTTIYSVADSVLWRPLPYDGPDRLMLIGGTWPGGGLAPLTPPMFRDWERGAAAFEPLAGSFRQSVDLAGRGEPVRLRAAGVSASFADVFRTGPVLGRWFTRDEDRPGGERVVVIGDPIWRSLSGGDPDIIGRRLTLDGDDYTVIGVMPRSFRPPEGLGLGETEIWFPIAHADVDFESHDNAFIRVVGRLGDGVSPDAATAEITALSNRLIEGYPERGVYESFRITSASLHRQTVGEIGSTLLLLLGAVAFLLLIACANVANLFLVRANERRSEMSLRAALGASRIRLARQLLTESLLVALIGGTGGVLIATLGVGAFVAWSPDGIPRIDEVSIDARVLGFSLVLATVTGIVFGLLPARRAARTRPSASLAGAGRATGGPRRATIRRTLVVAETGLTLVLLAGAGLLINSFVRLRGVDPGFDAGGVTAVHIALRSSYETRAARAEAFRLLGDRVSSLPGVESAGFSNGLPFGGGASAGTVVVEGHTPPEGAAERYVPWQLVSAGYFPTLGVSVLPGGRMLSSSDIEAEADVVLVNRAFVEAYWPGETGVGRRLKIVRTGGDDPWLEVVGVLPDFKQGNLGRATAPEVYLPYTQPPFLFPWMDYVVRPSGGAEARSPLAPLLRETVWRVDAAQPIDWIAPLEERISGSLVEPRFYALLLAAFAAVALALAMIGVYGITAYAVGQRNLELAVRVALGSSGGGLMSLVLRESAWILACGLAVGLVGAVTLSRLLTGLVFGIGTLDPWTYVGVSLLLVASGAIAAYAPARRAGRADPMAALRSD